MRLAMPPHLKVAAAHRRVAQSATIVDKALEAKLQAKKDHEAAEQRYNTAEVILAEARAEHNICTEKLETLQPPPVKGSAPACAMKIPSTC